MTYEIVDAKAAKQRIPVSIALSGGAGAGKTWTALMLAEQLAEGGKIGFLDTEAGRGLEYREDFEYRYLLLDPPFSPLRYEEAIQALIDDGCTAIVVDSGSHAYEEEGGLLDSVAAFCEEKANASRYPTSPDKFTPQAWAKFGPVHRHMIHFASRNSVPTVWCFRAREKTAVEKVEYTDRDGTTRQKIEFVPKGWQPITRDTASFEVSAFIMLEPVLETGCEPGTILRLKCTKPLEPHLKVGGRITAKTAKAIADYAKLKSAKPQKPTRTPSGAGKPSGHTDTENGSPRSEGAAVAQQLGISHDPPGFVEDDDPGFGGEDFAESDMKRARQLRSKIAKTHTMDGVSDLDGMVMDLKGLIPGEHFDTLNNELQAKSFEILKAEKAA